MGRVAGVGSVGTRYAVALLEDGDANTLVMQTKEAGVSVIEQHGEVKRFFAEWAVDGGDPLAGRM